MLSLGFNRHAAAHLFDGEASAETWIGCIRVERLRRGVLRMGFDLPRGVTVLRDELMRDWQPGLLDEVEGRERGRKLGFEVRPLVTLHVFRGEWTPEARVGGVFFARVDGGEARVSARVLAPYLVRPTLEETTATAVPTDQGA